MADCEQIFENNKRWIAEKKAGDGEYFDRLAQGQDPDILYIGCSDSRVIPEKITGLEPGEVFVHRNIANLIPNNDLNVMSVIEYAITHLQVKHIVVCGHYNCGGVKAAMDEKDLGIMNPWIRNIRDVFRTHQAELDAIGHQEKRYKRLVELNVEEQCMNVLKTASFQGSYYSSGYPLVHGWVFDIKSGELIDLKFNFREKTEEIRNIYNLGPSNPSSGK
jgi:carbonic anhydrase